MRSGSQEDAHSLFHFIQALSSSSTQMSYQTVFGDSPDLINHDETGFFEAAFMRADFDMEGVSSSRRGEGQDDHEPGWTQVEPVI